MSWYYLRSPFSSVKIKQGLENLFIKLKTVTDITIDFLKVYIVNIITTSKTYESNKWRR